MYTRKTKISNETNIDKVQHRHKKPEQRQQCLLKLYKVHLYYINVITINTNTQLSSIALQNGHILLGSCSG